MLERLKMLRKTLKLSQNQFSQKINFGQSSYANIENGTRNLTDRTIQLICNEFGVNEKWLRTGEGEMFTAPNDDPMDEVQKQYNLTDLERKVIEVYLKCSSEQRQATLDFIDKISTQIRVFKEEGTLPTIPEPTLNAMSQMLSQTFLQTASVNELRNLADEITRIADYRERESTALPLSESCAAKSKAKT